MNSITHKVVTISDMDHPTTQTVARCGAAVLGQDCVFFWRSVTCPDCLKLAPKSSSKPFEYSNRVQYKREYSNKNKNNLLPKKRKTDARWKRERREADRKRYFPVGW